MCENKQHTHSTLMFDRSVYRIHSRATVCMRRVDPVDICVFGVAKSKCNFKENKSHGFGPMHL